MTIHEIKNEKDNLISKLLNDCSVFFAFSNDQFAENKTPKAEGEKYVSMGAGGYLPKSKLDDYLKGSEEIHKWYKAEVNKTKNLRRDLIAYELSNYEAYYTGDIEDTMNALGSDYTKKEVWKVFHEENKKQLA